MPDNHLDILVVGAGLCGLAIAITAAQRGLTVRCISDGRPGASLANFGQLHSGAVFAPVLPDLAQACWRHRDRWTDHIGSARLEQSHGLALFNSVDSVERYQRAWHDLGIDAIETDPRGVGPFAALAAVFHIPDYSVHLPTLHARLLAAALASGVPPVRQREVTLCRDPTSTLVSIDASLAAARTIVLATGAATPSLLNNAGIAHPFRVRRIAWGRYADVPVQNLTYWLDGDLFAISPDSAGSRVGMPGTDGQYGTAEAELARLRRALTRRGLYPDDRHLRLLWGTVCEPANPYADTSSRVIDLRDPPPGWTRAGNLVVALPGKWTTAWQCADQVVDAIG